MDNIIKIDDTTIGITQPAPAPVEVKLDVLISELSELQASLAQLSQHIADKQAQIDAARALGIKTDAELAASEVTPPQQ